METETEKENFFKKMIHMITESDRPRVCKINLQIGLLVKDPCFYPRPTWPTEVPTVVVTSVLPHY